jgi:hypothetical protein
LDKIAAGLDDRTEELGRTEIPSRRSCCLLLGSIALATFAEAHDLSAEILVGFAGPLTGEMGLAGEEMQNGTDLAVAELNAAGGVLGEKIVIDHVDDHCDGEQAAAAARKLVADGIAVAIGHLCSNAAIPASEVYEAARIPFLTIASNPLVTGRDFVGPSEESVGCHHGQGHRGVLGPAVGGQPNRHRPRDARLRQRVGRVDAREPGRAWHGPGPCSRRSSRASSCSRT